jgi:myo-inositol-1(or 4)-monophosphatase
MILMRNNKCLGLQVICFNPWQGTYITKHVLTPLSAYPYIALMDNKSLLKIACRCVKEAGGILRRKDTSLRHVNETFAHDLKLAADRRVEENTRHILAKTGIPIIGEELGGDAGLLKSAGLYWAVDPLDGTVNYFQGVPYCCSSVGLWRGLTPVLGAVYDFNRNELFTGIVGEGASLGKCLIRASQNIVDRKKVLIYLSWSNMYSSCKDEQRHHVIALNERYQAGRSCGSTSLAIAYVAAGRFGAFYSAKTCIWDVAGSLAVLAAAGGTIKVRITEAFSMEVSAAWNEALLPEMMG